MGLATHAIALALGYALGNPESRAKLAALGGQAARRPEVKQARERAWDAAGEAGRAVTTRLTSRSRAAAKDGSVPAPGTDDRLSADTPPVSTATTAAAEHAGGSPATGPTNPTTTSRPGPATNGPTRTGAAGTGTAGTGTAGTGTAGTGTAGTGEDRLAGTTVAEDSEAAILGVPAPHRDRPAPPAQRD